MAQYINHKKTLSPEKYTTLCNAYGKEWDNVKMYTDKNGWCRLESSKFPNIDKQHNRIKVWWWRPKSLDSFLGCP